MRFVVLVGVAAGAGALAIFAIPASFLQAPASFLQSAASDMHAATAQLGQMHFTLADLNPLRADYDFMMQRVRAGQTPDQLGFHGSKVTFAPIAIPRSNFNFNPGPYSGNGIYSGMANHMPQNIYAQDPMAWHAPAPH
jgi:hypothetical protein